MKPGICRRAVAGSKSFLTLTSTSTFPLWRRPQKLRPSQQCRLVLLRTAHERHFASLQGGTEKTQQIVRNDSNNSSRKRSRRRQQNDEKAEENVKKAEEEARNQERTMSAEVFQLRKLYNNAPNVIFDTPELCFGEKGIFWGTFEKTRSERKYGAQECVYTAKVNGRKRSFRSSAAAQSGDFAERIAAWSLIQQFHECGLFNLAFPPVLDIPTEEELNCEHSNLESVYNRCAIIPTVPQIRLRQVEVKAENNKKTFRVSIELSEREIKVESRSETVREAEAVAALRFKAAADAYHSRHGGWPMIGAVSKTLSTENASKFLDYFCIERGHGSVVIDLRIEPLRGAPWSHAVAAYGTISCINGEMIRESAVILNYRTRKPKYKHLAALTAAVVLAKENPPLLADFMAAKKDTDGSVVIPLRPINMSLDWGVMSTMTNAIYNSKHQSSLPLDIQYPQDTSKTRLIHEHASSRVGIDSGSSIGNTANTPRTSRTLFKMDFEQIIQRNAILKDRQAALNNTKGLHMQRASLPMNQHRVEVRNLIERSPYSIIMGLTGSGKSTQVPQIILEDNISKGTGANINIICTQPRRIAAMTVANRVASERNEKLGDTIGYHVKYEKLLPKPGGSVTYCTNGVLFRQLEAGLDEVLDNTSHIIIDEVHERDLRTDFLLTTLKQALEARRRAHKAAPKLILMSASIDPQLFSKYFEVISERGEICPCPCLVVPGRTFPVKEIFLKELYSKIVASHEATELKLLAERETVKYLEAETQFKVKPWDQDNNASELIPLNLLAVVIGFVAKTASDDGAILVFLPGLGEIRKLESMLLEQQPLGVNFADSNQYKILLAHSELRRQQIEIFHPVPPGCRKIILATNIAETSLTISEVRHVIDTGKHRERFYNATSNMISLPSVWISKANSKQRAGRAGRVASGNYYGLFSRERYDSLQELQSPQMLRLDVQELCLHTKKQATHISIRDFLASAPEPPSKDAVESAIVTLQQLGALNVEEELMPLGKVLSSLPCHPSQGKMILLGIAFQCFDSLLILGASARGKGLFRKLQSDRQRVRYNQLALSLESQSDHVLTINAFRLARQLIDRSNTVAMQKFAETTSMNLTEWEDINETIREYQESIQAAASLPYQSRARDYSQRGTPELNENSENFDLAKALVVSCFPGKMSTFISRNLLRTRSETAVVISQQSINRTINDPIKRIGDSKNPTHNWSSLYVYNDLSGSRKYKSLWQTSKVSPLIAALFGGSLEPDPTDSRIVIVDDWIKLRLSHRQTLLDYRKTLDRVLGNFYDRFFMMQNKDPSKEDIALMDDEHKGFVKSLVAVLELDAEAARKRSAAK